MEGLRQVDVRLTTKTGNAQLIESLGVGLQNLILKAQNLQILHLKHIDIEATSWNILLSNSSKLRVMKIEDCQARGKVDFNCEFIYLTKLTVFRSTSVLPALKQRTILEEAQV